MIPPIDKTAPNITPAQATGIPKKNTEIREQNWNDINTIREIGNSTIHEIEVRQIGKIAQIKQGSIKTSIIIHIITDIIIPSIKSKIINAIGYDIGASNWNKINVISDIIISNKNTINSGITQVKRLIFGKQYKV